MSTLSKKKKKKERKSIYRLTLNSLFGLGVNCHSRKVGLGLHRDASSQVLFLAFSVLKNFPLQVRPVWPIYKLYYLQLLVQQMDED